MITDGTRQIRNYLTHCSTVISVGWCVQTRWAFPVSRLH